MHSEADPPTGATLDLIYVLVANVCEPLEPHMGLTS